MIMPAINYVVPESLEEAIALLKANSGSKPLAGGQNLLAKMRLQLPSPTLLVDLRAIPHLSGIQRTTNGDLRIGALTSLVEMAEDPDIQQSYPMVIEALKGTGDAQIRNRGTAGGSLVSDEVSSPLLAAALALEAKLQITNSAGTRVISVSDFSAQPQSGKPGVDEILTAIYFPAIPPRSGSAYEQLKRRSAVSSLCGIAVTVVAAVNRTIQTCRIAVAGVPKDVMHLSEIETALAGKEMTIEAIEAVFRTYQVEYRISPPLTSVEYQAHLTYILTQRALIHAWEQIQRAGMIRGSQDNS